MISVATYAAIAAIAAQPVAVLAVALPVASESEAATARSPATGADSEVDSLTLSPL